MNQRAALLLTMAASLNGVTALASHISGGEIVYTCLGGNQYQVTLNLFRDCVGINVANTQTVDFTSPCGTQSVTLPQISFSEVSQLCPTDLPNSACNGGSLPGMQMYTFSAVVTLPPCDTWTMSWVQCCRNAAIDNLVGPGNLDTYIQATLNSASFPCDNSPTFNNVPIPYVCQNQPVQYSFGVSEVDGDSLVYSFIAAMEGGGVPVPYVGGFTALSPIPGIALNPLTGLLTFTPTQLGNFVVTVMVTQYDDAGNVIGTVMRDIQFVVIPCTNQAPDPLAGSITNFSGSATQTGPYSIEMCETNDFCFDFVIQDPDAGQILTLSSNIAQLLPGATFNWTGTNPVNGPVCWTAPPGSNGVHPFIINAVDDACPVAAFQTYVYDVTVLTRTTAGPDQVICGSQVAQLDGNGGSVFTWTVMNTTPPGSPIQVGVNFSCNPCEDPIAQPAVTTTYIVTSDLASTCLNGDTVMVSVVPNFSFQASQSDSVLCLGEMVQLGVTVNPNVSGYLFDWSPPTGLSATNIPDPIGTYNLPGTYPYVVGVTSPDGCYYQDSSIVVLVTPGYPPIIDVSAVDSLVCEGASTQLMVNLDCSFPAICGPYSGPCCGPVSSATVGAGTQAGTTTGYPAPFGHFYEGVKHQILYRASELQALGFAGGKISELAWNIQSINGTTEYHDWDIRIGCTTETQLTGTWLTGLTQVYFNSMINIQTGWNNFVFNTDYNWDGVSNLVVEVCFNNDGYLGSYTLNSPTFYTVTAYNSVQYRNNDNTPTLCPSPGIPVVSTDRPNTRFTYCGGVDASNLQYTWTPATGLSDPTVSNPTVTPQSSPVVYSVTVGETGSGCTTTQQVTLGWYPPASIYFQPDPPGGVYPVSIHFLNQSANGSNGFTWIFGDGSGNSSEFDPTHVYTSPGVYYVTLNGYSEFGCFGTYTDSVIIISDPIVEIPNVFSPNGDGQNDGFAFIDFRGFQEASMKIFNRWGMLVHESKHSSSISNQKTVVWRPTNETPSGTYYYEFIGHGSNGDLITKTGHITLLR